jgi:hypothetical protein
MGPALDLQGAPRKQFDESDVHLLQRFKKKVVTYLLTLSFFSIDCF